MTADPLHRFDDRGHGRHAPRLIEHAQECRRAFGDRRCEVRSGEPAERCIEQVDLEDFLEQLVVVKTNLSVEAACEAIISFAFT